MFHTVLVANRGEIAVRVISTLHAMGIKAVAVYSDADADALHTRMADVAVRLGPAPATESYLRADLVVAAAQRTGAQAVHPGYGFLSENANFARALDTAGITFIGPPIDAIQQMGDKISAKDLAIEAGAPVVPGVHRAGMSDEDLIAAAPGVGYPLMVKAAAGGGGKGMRVVETADGLAEAITAARREAKGGFGDDTLMLERFVQRPRHIEIQVLCDAHGNGLWVGERECSLQRRHQKVIEECPSPALDDETRVRMGEAAVAIAKRVGYVGAGTVEFITDADAKEFFFLEMNTRLQVEHPVTEEVYGLDLVAEQVRVAAGEPLTITQADLVPQGHAVEARLYAEDPSAGFLPTGGQVVRFDWPADVRVDAGVARGHEVASNYDPMLAKVIAVGADRAEALAKLDRALADTRLFGFPSNIAFLRALLADADVRAGELHTGLIADKGEALTAQGVPDEVYAAVGLATIAARQPAEGAVVDPFDLPGGWRLGEAGWTRWRLRASGTEAVEVRVRSGRDGTQVAVGDGEVWPATVALSGDQLQVDLPSGRSTWTIDLDDRRAWIGADGKAWLINEEDLLEANRGGGDGALSGTLVAPMPGSVAAVNASVGQDVTAGQTLVVVEAMKMEHPLVAPFDGTVSAVHVQAGSQVGMEDPLVEVAPTEADES